MTSEALVHIERLLAETYRREIEQEENIWRSLPFFAATLALELAALSQVIDRLPPVAGWLGRVSLGLLVAAALANFVALGFLAAAIFPAKFRYISPDGTLLEYVELLIATRETDVPGSAISELRALLAQQYADATDHNRGLNRRRERRRSVAGMATISAILLTLLLVATTFSRYALVHLIAGTSHG